MRVIAITAAAVLLAAGCANDQVSPPAASTSPSTSTPVKATPKPSPPASTPVKLTAEQVVAAFAAAKLPVRNPRDNSRNCESLGCAELTTTDDISVYTWDDPAAQKRFVTSFGPTRAFSLGNVVLSYAAARTPAAARPKYQQVLKGMG